jgi:nucleoside-diphosphate-sugar epimerase
MSQTHQTVLIVGVQGISGRHAAEHYARQPNTEVIGISRRPGDLPGVQHLSADLLQPEELRRKLEGLRESLTHVVFAAYLERPTAAERSSINRTLLENLLDGVEDFPALQHIAFYQGGKSYGSDLGPYKTPAREDDPRMMPPNFYYDQEDLIRQRQQGRAWHFTALRPDGIGGFATGNPMNITMVIAVYAALSKELGLPLRFPGTEAAYRAEMQLTSADILAEATIWAGSSAAARNEIFNITNGDTFRWQHLWPRIAEMFQMKVADPAPISLSEYMADKEPLWNAMVSKYGLAPIPYDQVVSWPFGDAVFGLNYDNVFSTIKARRAGFHNCIDTEEMFTGFFAKLRENRVIPPL